MTESISKLPLKVKELEDELKILDKIEIKAKEKLEIRFNMMLERCKQHYSLTLARLSAYWSGVLQKIRDNKNISCSFYSMGLFKELEKEIEGLKKGEE